MLRKTLISLSVSLLLATIFHASAFAQKRNDGPLSVFVAPVQHKQMSDTVEALGTLRARNNVSLAATVTELVTAVNFTDGQRVKQGDILVRMDDSEQQALLTEERARLLEAERSVKRFAPLADRGAASQSALEQSQALLSAAQARIKAIETRIAQRQIVAPFDGVLGLRNISVGALVQPGTVITTIDDDEVMKLDFAVPELFIGGLGVGNEITAKSDAFPDERYLGSLESIDSRVDPVTRSLMVRALLDNPDRSLKPGLLMRVKLARNPRPALVLQEEAVVPEGLNKFVFVLEKNQGKDVVRKQRIEVGQRREGEVEVLSGVTQADTVVIHGVQRLRNGSQVTVLATETDGQTLKQLLGNSH